MLFFCHLDLPFTCGRFLQNARPSFAIMTSKFAIVPGRTTDFLACDWLTMATEASPTSRKSDDEWSVLPICDSVKT